ncbi:hypothetical protein QUB68_08645 [Microcoleus sp. A006_D1]|uniref:hypothetical protein n=1 Tax=Microcoleus sp. A006_D1 TaxID=3055267 RepID=UPI002FD626AC
MTEPQVSKKVDRQSEFRGFSLWTGSVADLQRENRPFVNSQLCDHRHKRLNY